MKLLIALIALMVGWLAGGKLRDLKHGLIHWWFERLLGRNGQLLRPVVLTLIPGLAVAVAHLYLLSHGYIFSAAVLALVALVFAWGSRDLDSDVRHYLQAESAQARSSAARCLLLDYYRPASPGMEAGTDVDQDASLAPEPNASAADNDGDNPGQGHDSNIPPSETQWEDSTDRLVEGVFYQALARWFGALFWFLVAGPGGAVAFRFLHALLAEQRNLALLSDQQRVAGRRWLALVDWPAAVLASIGLAMVGDFDRVAGGSRKLIASSGLRNIAREVWPKLGALTVGSAPDNAFEHDFSGAPGQVNLAMNLVWRVLVCWLTVAALVTVVMVIN